MPSGSLPFTSGEADDFGFRAGPAATLAPGTDIGGITIVRLLGAGGMGCVYEARQHAPDRPVAVKLMREGVVSPTQFKRFEYEAEVLGRLEHPGIARVYLVASARVGPFSTPSIVMELVPDARPVTTFCAEQGWAGRQRVALMRKIAAAVAYAHQKGVIHRDLKPGNILVDQMGAPKIIDFGVARSIDDSRQASTMLTEAGHLVGTLHYMSPEQLSGSGTDVDARSDVHALGLVLYELLVGRLPYDLRGRSPLEAARIVATAEAPIATAVIEALKADRTITRDDARSLAAIVATCLEKRPESRYATAADVAAELGRWLAGEPILARPPGLGRAIARLARKHRLATASTAGVLAALVTAVVGISVFAVRAERAAIAARAQLYRATVLLAVDARDRGAVDEAGRLADAARTLADAAGPRQPIELACLAASLDESVEMKPGHGDAVRAVAWSPDGRLMAAVAAEGIVRVSSRNMETDAPPHASVLRGHAGPVWSLAWSPDGRTLASASADATARVWDVETGAERLLLRGHEGIVYGIAFSPDGRRLATGGRDGIVRIWNASDGREARSLSSGAGTVYAVCFSPAGDLVATASQDGGVRLWDAESGAARGLLVGHATRAFSVCFSPDGRRVAAAAEDGAVRVWDLDADREVAVLRHPFKANAAAFVAAGTQLVTVSDDCIVRWWDIDRAIEIAGRRGHRGAVWSIAAARDNAWLITGSADATVRVWAADGGCDPVVACGEKVHALAASTDGRACAVGTASGLAVVSLADLRVAAHRLCPGQRVNDTCFVGTGDRLIAACDDGIVAVCGVPAGANAAAEQHNLKLHVRRVFSVDVDAGGTRLATAGEDRAARLWNMAALDAKAEPLASFKHERRVLCARFAPDGSRLFTACEDRLARMWDLASGRERMRYVGHDGPVNWLAVSAAGRLLATASSDATVRLWDANSGAPLATLRGPARQVRKVAFTADETRLIGVGDDGAAHVWDVASGEAVSVLRGHADQAWALAITADGGMALTGSWDGTVRAWGISAADLFRRRQAPANTWPSVSWSTPALRFKPCTSLGHNSSSMIRSAPLRPTTVGTEMATSRMP
jgi:WD40 repeat protein